MKIADFLSHSSENAVGLRDLANLTDQPERVVRQQIQRERLSGVPILSDNTFGYFLPGNNAEIARCVRSLRHRAEEIIRVADAIEKAGEHYDG